MLKFVRVVDADSAKTVLRRLRRNMFIKYKGELLVVLPYDMIYSSEWPHRVVIIREKKVFVPHPKVSYAARKLER